MPREQKVGVSGSKQIIVESPQQNLKIEIAWMADIGRALRVVMCFVTIDE